MINKLSKKAYSMLEIIFILIALFLCVYVVNANPYLKDYFSKIFCTDSQKSQEEKQNDNSPKLKDMNTYIARTRTAVANVFQALQLLRTTREDGVSDFSSEGLIKYFQSAMQSQITSNDTFVTSNGMIFKFISNGDCIDDNSCYLQIDTNGEAGPNKIWTNPDEPSDIIILPVKNKNGTVSIEPPAIYNQF